MIPLSRLFRRQRRAQARDTADPRASLRAEVAALESELALQAQRLDAVLANAAALEERAVTAIRAGDVYAARNALALKRTCAEEAALLEADIHVLRAILVESSDCLRDPLPWTHQ